MQVNSTPNILVIYGLCILLEGRVYSLFTSICPDDTLKETIINSNKISTTFQTSVVFKVQCCGEATVVLTNDSVLPNTKYSIIIKQDPNYSLEILITTHASSNIQPNVLANDREDTELKCNQFNTFWISWERNITLGNGEVVDKDIILSASLNSVICINYIGVQSSNNKDQVHWMIESGTDSLTFRKDVLCEVSTTTATTEATMSSETEMTTEYALTSDNAMVSIKDNFVTSTTDKITKTIAPTCVCETRNDRWEYLYSRNLTSSQLRQELRDHIEELSKSIAVNKKETKRYLATKKSAHDDRVSSKSIGMVGSLIISLFIVFIFILDILTCFESKKRLKK